MNYKPDVIYSVDLDTLLAGGLSSRILKSKLIHDAHEYFVEVPELEGKTFKKKVWNWIGLKFIPECDLCFSVNQELAGILSEKYNNKFQVIRSVPSLQSKNTDKKILNDKPIILYQGMLNKGRGLEEAIEAVCNLKLEVVFKIAGEGDLSTELRTLAKQLDSGERIKFLGWLSPTELKLETQKADVGLNLLSGKSLNYKYSLANKFFDYMHAGVPSINMNFPVYTRICDRFEVGVCIDSLDKESIQDAIITLVSDAEKADRIAKGCEEAVLTYNWEAESRRLVSMITSSIS